ncbi:MAG: HAMP domain-containing sensor histidine kinase [Nocardioidaceae bacterium]|nr:HAMP domain-containing sensor histidine kinase [Nocardioidaceae bacterium]
MSVRERTAALPLRVRLVAILVLSVIVGLAVTAVVANVVLERSLVSRVDDQLGEQSRRFGDQRFSTPPMGDPGGDGDRDRPQLPSPLFVQYVDAAGQVVVRRSDDRRSDRQLPDLGTLDADRVEALGTDPFTVGSTGGGTQWRVVVRPLDNGDSVVTALDLDDVDETVSRLALIETGVAGLVAVLLGGAGYLVVRSSLRPLVEVEHTAEAIAAGDLSARVPDLDPRTEVGGLSVAINQMLVRIEDAVRSREEAADSARDSEQRMRRFVADASHELRTPLTSIRGFADLYAQGGSPDRDTTDRFMGRIQSESARMGLLVEDLLVLARMDQDRPLDLGPVDLVPLAEEVVQDARLTEPDRPVVRVAGSSRVVVTGDADRLRQVLTNLVRNALVHTPPGTPVSVSVQVDDGEGVLVVRDKGPGMSAEDAAKVFERFYRAERSRSRVVGGSGLGLSIVSALVDAHGGSVDLRTAPGEGATFTVRLPLA